MTIKLISSDFFTYSIGYGLINDDNNLQPSQIWNYRDQYDYYEHDLSCWIGCNVPQNVLSVFVVIFNENIDSITFKHSGEKYDDLRYSENDILIGGNLIATMIDMSKKYSTSIIVGDYRITTNENTVINVYKFSFGMNGKEDVNADFVYDSINIMTTKNKYNGCVIFKCS